tara:strand:+ start:128 stop:994 length:867 start_codon:yes stop_codon:yes gene_type:complete
MAEFINFIVKILYMVSNLPIIRDIVRWFARLSRRKTDKAIIINNYTMYANTFDRILALNLWKNSLFEDFEMKIVDEIAKEGMTVLDVGANIGLYTLNLADKVGISGKVYSFEPEPNNFRLLNKNIVTNSFTNVITFQKAVSNTSGHTKLFCCDENQGDHRIFDSHDARNSIDIETVALDDEMQNIGPIDLIKTDIQGAEYHAFCGMEKIIKQNENLIIICEFAPRLLEKNNTTADMLLDKIELLGFHINLVDEILMKIIPISKEDLIKKNKGNKYCNLYLSKQPVSSN